MIRINPDDWGQRILLDRHVVSLPQELLAYLSSRPDLFECIIISDSNTFFIDWCLEAHGVKGLFRHVFTNTASWLIEEEGGACQWAAGWQRLSIRPFHEAPHGCPNCDSNLCKRRVLQDVLDRRRKEGGRYEAVLYIGDGKNDLCPAQSLREHDDAVFPRVGYALHRTIVAEGEQGANSNVIGAQVVAWESGLQVLQWLQERSLGMDQESV